MESSMKRARFISSTAILLALALTAILGFAGSGNSSASSGKDFRWVLAVPENQGEWPRWNMPVAAFDGKLWAVQESHQAWSSADGIHWQRHASNGGWGERFLPSVVFFQNELWVLGGRSGSVAQSTFWNDVWASANGTDWIVKTRQAAWSPRWDFTTLVFRDKLWVFGGKGAGAAHDAWSSSDGVNWARAAAALPWPAGAASEVFVYQDALWCFSFGETPQLWRSADGVQWTRTAVPAPWGKMLRKDVVVFGDRIWMMGGANVKGEFYNDVWSSANGVRWELIAEHAPWWPRLTNYSVVFDGKFWIYGGKNAKDDVWCLLLPAARAAR